MVVAVSKVDKLSFLLLPRQRLAKLIPGPARAALRNGVAGKRVLWCDDTDRHDSDDN